MANVNKIGKHATKVKSNSEYISITYHSTDVVKFNDNEIILNTGGWKTHSTKTRMNQVSNEYSLGYSVSQKNGVWYVDYNNAQYVFDENVLHLAR